MEENQKKLVPRFNTKQFKEHFRMNPHAFYSLENVGGEKLSSSSVCVQKQLLSVIWLLATPDSYRSVAQRFDLAKSSLHACFITVVNVLNEIAPNVISWPAGENLMNVEKKFRRMAGLSDVIGAIDASLILIKAPEIDAQYYVCRKRFHALILQAVCDRDLVFTDCFAGYPGSIGDLRVFRNSDLYKDVDVNREALFPNDEYVIGDKTYPVLPWCIPPYLNRVNLTPDQERVRNNFNTILSKTRQVIKRAFALLKGRFPRLKYFDMDRMDLMPHTIISCCVLHNICLRSIDEDIGDYIREGAEIEVNEPEKPMEVNNRAEAEGMTKRDYIAACL
ncbi:uncharacterized protein LOC127282158 [Leptopilina boulardi]|uniref:uncharacterized protein LOC127282158 n=1 Tax=Leptopilina boulardi TaxID=63433 RepID=UPI0021F5928B|nr:uncharacterized protein LOC127282158 [Leptopilina boulardi]